MRVPKKVWDYVKNVRRKPLGLPVFISALLPTQNKLIEEYCNEFERNCNLREDYYKALYAITRILNPEKIIETGVFHGHSSLAFLLAMKENDKGLLYSIDLPSPDLPRNQKPGWLVPQDLRERWDLRLGESYDLLPNLLKEVEGVGIFLHDSEHSYKNMYWEYETAWAHVRKGGALLSHDISQNQAFRDFSKAVSHSYYYMLHNLGGIRK